jgi:hypothetical protein
VTRAALGLRKRLVQHRAQQLVSKGERGLGVRRGDQHLVLQRIVEAGHQRRGIALRDRLQHRQLEAASDHGGARQHSAGVRIELADALTHDVERAARQSQPLAVDRLVVAQAARQLGHEERIALAAREHRRFHFVPGVGA